MGAEGDSLGPFDPFVFRSAHGKQLICVMRENNRKGHSLMMTPTDEGKTWSPLKETP